MAGTYRQLKNGKWELAVSLGKDLRGKRIRKYKYVEASGKREAEKLLAKFVAECTRGDYSEGERMPLKDYAELWMKDYAEKNLRKKTISRYKSLLERIVGLLGDIRLCDLKPTHLIQFYNMLQENGIRKDKEKIVKDGQEILVQKQGGLSPKTIRHHHALLSSMLQTAVEWGIIKENICERVKPPKVPKTEKTVFTIEQAQELIKALNTEELKYKVIVILAIFTGFRRGEIMGLEWSDINFEEGIIEIKRTSLYTKEYGIFEDETKTKSSVRAAYIPKEVVKLLKEYKMEWNTNKAKAKDKWHETDRLFVQWNGLPMHPDTISQWFPEFIRRHNLPHVTFHGLRHTHASILLAMGMDIVSVADQMGHGSIEMLIKTYAHNVRKGRKEVPEYLSRVLLPDKNNNEKNKNLAEQLAE